MLGRNESIENRRTALKCAVDFVDVDKGGSPQSVISEDDVLDTAQIFTEWLDSGKIIKDDPGDEE